MNQDFEQAVTEIRNQPIDDAAVEAAAARVWARLQAEALAVQPPHIADCAGFQALFGDLRANRLDAARATLLRDHLHECVACRRVYEGRVVAMPQPPARIGAAPASWYKLAAAAAVVVVAGSGAWFALQQFGHSGHAVVQSVNGALYAVRSDGIHPLAAGAPLPDGVEIRTAKDSTALLELRDGSVVEMRERSALMTSQAPRDISVRLERGSVIIQAAHRSQGHLFVATADCRVAVTGTIFGVTAGAKGSRVSVVQGEVRVDQDGREKVLQPGTQTVTSPDLEPESVKEDLSWSRNRARYDSILASLGQALSQIQQPDLRRQSNLLGRLPANVMFYAGIPNLAQYLGDAEEVFRKKMEQSPELEAWQEANGGRTAAVLEKLRAASEYLGDEIAVVGVNGADGPAFLAELKRPGFADFLKQAAPAGGKPAEMERNGLVLFGAPRAVEQLSGVLDSASGGIQSTDFYREVEEVYQNGAGFLLCVNVAGAAAQKGETAPPALANAQALIFNETQVNGVKEARVTVEFKGPRTGIAAWLASPAPMGALDYVSRDASAAVAAVVPDGAAIVDRLKMIAPEQLGAVRDALAGSLGGEFALALDGPLMPVPSWKLIAEVYDPAAAQAALQQAVASYTMDPRNAGHKPLTTAQETFEGRTYYSIAVPNAGPLMEFHYTFADGYMIAGPSRAVIARALQIKDSASSILHASKITAMMPRDHHADFSLLFYQNLGPAMAPIAGLLGGMAPGGIMPGRGGRTDNPSGAMGSVSPTLIAGYAEPDRLTFAANGDLLGPALAGLLRGDVAGAARGAIPFLHDFQSNGGTRKRENSYK